MSFSQCLLLGTVSGLTIFLGMPLARFRAISRAHLSFLNALAVGVLFFLFVDIMGNVIQPMERAIRESGHHLALLIAVLIAGFGIGLMTLVYYGRHYLRKEEGMSKKQIALLVAIGIGMHNFSEGLAIGNSAVQGELKTALLLIIGFGLHNITEAFGIAAPLAGDKKVSWSFLLILGLIGGGPNFVGTIIGYSYSSEVLSVLFLSLAAGAIMYVIGELFAAGRKLQAHAWAGWGLTLGFFAGLLTDFILIAAGV